MSLTPPDENPLLAHPKIRPKLRQALGRPVRYFGRCSGCVRYDRCTEKGSARYCDGCSRQG